MTKLLKDQLKDLNEDIIPDLLDIRISSSMSVPTLRALEAIYTLRSWLASESHDINEHIYANLQVERMYQISKALKTKYRRANTLTDKIEILSFIDSLEQDLSCEHSDFAIEEASKLAKKHTSTLTIFQRLRLQLITRGSDFSELKIDEYRSNQFCMSQLAAELLPQANTPFELGTLTMIEHLLTPSLREAIFTRFTILLETAIQQLTTPTTAPLQGGLGGLLTLFPYWNSNPIHRSLIKNLSEKTELALKEAKKITNLDSNPSEARIISRLNPIAAEIYTRLASLPGKYSPLTA